MEYNILGMDYSNGDVATVLLHVSESIECANSWVVGYARHGDMGGYDAINVVAPSGVTKSEFTRDFGWNHY